MTLAWRRHVHGGYIARFGPLEYRIKKSWEGFYVYRNDLSISGPHTSLAAAKLAARLSLQSEIRGDR